MTHDGMLLLLMAALIIKHFFCDFPLQSVYMLGKGKGGFDWILPLASHTGVHALFTSLIFFLYQPRFFWLGLIDFSLHFIIDRIKATHRLEPGIWTPEQRGKNLSKYYTAFGLDQMAHSLTYILLIYLTFLL